jgi:hypothetical protein
MNGDATASSESKALRLARYLKDFVGLRSTTVYDVDKYESVLWFGDMPQEPECQSPAWNHEFVADDPWLVVHKQQFPKPPVPPEIIIPWIDQQALKRATEEMPRLRPARLEPDLEAEIGEGEEPPLVERHLDDHPEVVAAYDSYRVRRAYDDDAVKAATLRVIGTDKLPAPADFGMMVATEREAKEAVDRFAGLRMHLAYSPIIAHGGVHAAWLAAQPHAAAAIFNDAGVGRDRAGIGGLDYLQEFGFAAATVGHDTARIGDGADIMAYGIVKHASGASEAP